MRKQVGMQLSVVAGKVLRVGERQRPLGLGKRFSLKCYVSEAIASVFGLEPNTYADCKRLHTHIWRLHT